MPNNRGGGDVRVKKGVGKFWERKDFTFIDIHRNEQMGLRIGFADRKSVV